MVWGEKPNSLRGGGHGSARSSGAGVFNFDDNYGNANVGNSFRLDNNYKKSVCFVESILIK